MTHAERKARRGEMARAVAAGGSLSDTATLFGVPPNQVYRACREFGVESRVRGDGAVYRVVAALCNTRNSFAAVALATGVSRQRVGQIYAACVAAGVPVRPRPAPNGEEG